MNSRFHKILVLGNTGYGKSTLCNYILSYEKKKCKESENPESCTFEINGYPANENSEYKDIFMIDTPGLSDGKGRDQEIIDKITDQMKKKFCQGIKSIIIVENATIQRLSKEAQRQISIFCRMFQNKNFWQHVGIVFSFSSESWPDAQIKKVIETKQKVYMKSVIDFVKNEIKEMKKDFIIPNCIQMFFTDCGEVFPPNTHKRTDKEIQRLVSWTRSQDYIDFDPDDFNAIFADCKEYKHIADSQDTFYDENFFEEEKNEINKKIKEKNKDKDYMKNIKEENIKKETIKYTKIIEALDFYNKTYQIKEKEHYKDETYYIKTITYYKNEQQIVSALDKEKINKKVYTSKELWVAIIKFDTNGEQKQIIKDECVKDDCVDAGSIIIEKCEFKVDPELTEYKRDPNYTLENINEIRDSESAVQKYYEEQYRKFGGSKLKIFIADLSTLFLAPIIGFFIDLFRGVKPKWIIRGRKFGDVRLKKETKKNELGAIREGNWEIDHIYSSDYEYEMPYQL